MITIRNIQSTDSEAVFVIRNLPSVYKYFRNSREVTQDEHASWFETQQQPSRRRTFFVALEGDKMLGYLRYDFIGKAYNISIAIAPEFQQKGIGGLLLRSTLPKIAKRGKQIRAEVNKENIASSRFFEKHGFTRLREGRNSITFVWTSSEGRINA